MGDGRRVVLWTRSARDSLDEILAFIALDSPAVASKVAEDVLGAADSLSLFAERGRIVPETDTIAIREIFVYRYRLMYQVSIGEVRILAVLAFGGRAKRRWQRPFIQDPSCVNQWLASSSHARHLTQVLLPYFGSMGLPES